MNKANWKDIIDEISQVDWSLDTPPTPSGIDATWEYFFTTILNICHKHSPSRHTTRNANHTPKTRKVLINKIKRANKKINSLKFSSKHHNHTHKITALEERKTSLQLQLRQAITSERLTEEKKIISQIKSNPRALFSFAKKHKTAASPIGPLTETDGTLTNDALAMAELLQHQYCSVFSSPNSSVIPVDTVLHPDPGKILSDISFDYTDFLKAIGNIHQHSSAGPDRFPAKVLKECRHYLARPLSQLWRMSLDASYIPKWLLDQTITPVFKKGNRSLPCNYRPVSLTSHLTKAFERVICSQISEFLETNSLLDPNQHGFRSNRNCLTQLTRYIDDVLNSLAQGSSVDALYLDFSKAFDKVDHHTLLNKLSQTGIRGKLLAWIEYFLTNRTQRVSVDGTLSGPANVTSGVPQGTVLGPLLFIIYINDITNSVEHSNIAIFADDSKLWRTIDGAADRDLLQRDLSSVNQWAIENSMVLNEQKFELLHFGKTEIPNHVYTLPSGITLSPSHSVRDLGVTVDRNLTWTEHIGKKVNTARKTCAWLLRVFHSRDRHTITLLFTTYARPHLDYCCPLWSPHTIKLIQKIEAPQRSITRHIEGLSDQNYWDRLKSLGLYSLQRRRERYIICVMWKLYHRQCPNDTGI
ncbi:hypothetical protein Ahia01_000640300, partial [Argonauta hians]